MAQFDVCRASAVTYYLDCQSDLLRDLTHRFVVPLWPEAEAPIAATRLNPVFIVEGRRFVMLTQFAAAVPKGELRDRVSSLADDRHRIIGAIDLLTSGV